MSEINSDWAKAHNRWFRHPETGSYMLVRPGEEIPAEYQDGDGKDPQVYLLIFSTVAFTIVAMSLLERTKTFIQGKYQKKAQTDLDEPKDTALQFPN
jgi:hypothetical protein